MEVKNTDIVLRVKKVRNSRHGNYSFEFAGCTLPTHRNRQVKSSLNFYNWSPSFEIISVFMTVAILAAIFLV